MAHPEDLNHLCDKCRLFCFDDPDPKYPAGWIVYAHSEEEAKEKLKEHPNMKLVSRETMIGIMESHGIGR